MRDRSSDSNIFFPPFPQPANGVYVRLVFQKKLLVFGDEKNSIACRRRISSVRCKWRVLVPRSYTKDIYFKRFLFHRYIIITINSNRLEVAGNANTLQLRLDDYSRSNGPPVITFFCLRGLPNPNLVCVKRIQSGGCGQVRRKSRSRNSKETSLVSESWSWN